MNDNKQLWDADRKAYDLKYPDENVIRFLFHNKSIKTGLKILDFGCGSGRNTKVMADLGFDICAMDYNEECLNLTAQKMGDYEKVEYIVNSELKVPKEENYFDCIVAWGALFCLSRKEEKILFKDLIRTLKPGGLLLADYRSKDDYLFGRGEEIEKDLYLLSADCGTLSGITYAFRDMSDISDLYSDCNMKILNYEKLDHYVDNCRKKNSHYIIWARKD